MGPMPRDRRTSGTAGVDPSQWEADVVLRDGSVGHVRPITPDDADRLRSFHSGQSDESIYLRFFAPIRELSDRDVYRFTHVDNVDRVALVMTVRGAIIGIGRWDRIDRRSAEVAFNISDHYQGKGIGSVLLEHLAAIAQELGVEQFTAEVLPQNRRMLNVFKEAGYAVHHHFEDGVVEVAFDIRPTEQSNAVRVAREHRAESVSMHGLLHPASIAVIGASRRAASIGSRFLANILAGGYAGPVYAVNNEALEVQGLPAYARVGEIPDPSTLPCSQCPRTTCSTSWTSAPRRVFATCSSPRPASPRAVPTERSARSSCAAAPGRTGCAWSARTRSG